MIYANFTGRVGGKNARVIDGANGQFLSMDLAVNDVRKGEEVTTWVRVQSSNPNHIKLAQYLTKGRVLTISGVCKVDLWEAKSGPVAQLKVYAHSIDFLNVGKKKDKGNPAANALTAEVPESPKDAPKEKKDDLPF